MKISPISFWSVNNINNNNKRVSNPIINTAIEKDSFVRSSSVNLSKPSNPPKTINFMGYPIHIIDGGKHAKVMEHFAKLDMSDVDIHLHKAEQTEDWDLNKPFKNILEQLKDINKFGLTEKDSYVAIPVKISVPLQNLAEQYKRVMGNYLHLRTHTTQTCKSKIMDFLKVLYEKPETYKKYIRYMDPENQGLEYTYGIIQEINKLNCKKVYVPAEHPQHETLNWLAGVRGEKPELTNFLATGYDKDGKVNNMLNYIRGEGWYDFNLLALSKADVVNLKKADGFSDHIYSAYDTTVNDGARGVYNLSPVRENGNLVGYSFKDMVTNEYPVSKFPFNEEVADVARFVGRKVDDVVADDAQTYAFRQALEENQDTSSFSDKLYPVWKLFDEDKLFADKIYDKGDFVDSSLKNYYRRNEHYEIICPEADCESNGRPSVKAMWGSEYSVLNAIKRDIRKQQFVDSMRSELNVDFGRAAYNTYQDVLSAIEERDFRRAEADLSKVISYNDMDGFNRRDDFHTLPYKQMGDVKLELGDYVGADWHYNFYINKLSKNFLEDYAKSESYHATQPIRTKIAEAFSKLAEVARCR